MELGHFNKHAPIARERKAPQDKNLRVFCLGTLKNFILNDKFYLKMTTIRAFFLEIRALFSNFQKRAGKTSSPPPSSYPPAACGHYFVQTGLFKSPFCNFEQRFFFGTLVLEVKYFRGDNLKYGLPSRP